MPEQKYLTAIMLGDDLAHKISIIQNKYRVSRWQERIGPHVTLNRPFTINGKKDDLMITQILSDTAKRHKPFIVTLDGVGLFSGEKETIYARVTPSPALLGLQQYLNIALDSYVTYTSPIHGFTPHVTLSDKLTVDETDAQLAEIHGLVMQDEFSCKCFNLLSLDAEENKWRTIAQFPLG